MLSNACKFQKSGVITIVAYTTRRGLEYPIVSDTTTSCETFITVQVKDKGKGIAPENIESIFKPFGT